MKREIGEPLAEGIIAGVSGKKDELAATLIEVVTDAKNETIEHAKNAGRQIAAEVAGGVDKAAGAMLRPAHDKPVPANEISDKLEAAVEDLADEETEATKDLGDKLEHAVVNLENRLSLWLARLEQRDAILTAQLGDKLSNAVSELGREMKDALGDKKRRDEGGYQPGPGLDPSTRPVQLVVNGRDLAATLEEPLLARIRASGGVRK